MRIRGCLLLFCVFLAVTLGAYGQKGLAEFDNLRAGGVYVMTNQVQNSIVAFARSPKTGMLTEVETELTQGVGDPVPIPPDPPIDPLASQGAIALGEGSNYLYAVNAGSNEISVLAVSKDGLEFVEKVSSGGVRPISLTIYNGWLYVLNEGGTPNITGFSIADDGTLTPIAGSTRPLIGGGTADPAQVGFNNDGTLLVVTEKAGNRLDTYVVDSDGVAGPPIANSSSGMAPFGFAFNNSGYLVVSEAMSGAVSSYGADKEGDLDLISGSVANQQMATCWLVITNSGRHAFVSNTASDTLSSYGIGDDGTVTLIDADAATTGTGSAPIDMALSVNSRFLYVLENGSHVVSAWHVRGGTLTLIGEFGELPAGSQGIAAK